MNLWKVKNPRKDLRFEIAFTKAYRDAVRTYTHPAQIELACLKAQYPAIMMPIEDDDVLAGRIQMGLVGMGIQGQTGGTGYYIDEPRVTQALEQQSGDAKYREDLHDLLTFWKGHCTYNIVLEETPEEIRRVIPTEQWKTQPVPASPIIRMAGAYVNYDHLLQVGICGLEDEIRSARKTAQEQERDVVIYDCMLGALEVLKDVCRHYQAQASELAQNAATPQRRREMQDLAAALEQITKRAPQSMLEAIQLAWLYSMMAQLIEFGRMDVYLGDFYCHDIDNGIITEAQARRMVQSFYRLVDHLDCDTDGRVIVGGYGRRNPENADRFCMVAIEACRTVREILPQFTLRFNRETPKEVWDASMRCIGEGRTFPLLYNDDVLVPGVMHAFRVPRERAETYMPLGCGEIEFDHYSFGSPNGSVNTLKILELAIRGGYDPIAHKYLTIKTTPLTECTSYVQFLENYKTQLHYFISTQAKYERYLYHAIGSRHPFMLVGMLYDGVIESGKPFLDGGCAYLAGTMELYGNVNAANSLAAIKKLIFEEHQLTAQELVSALDDNFYMHNRTRKLLMDCPKYGNDDDYVDSIFVELHNYLCATTAAQAEKVGLCSYLSVTINNKQNTTLGRWVGATPDGRKAGTPMANAKNPAAGTDKNGLPAMLNSILKPSHSNHAGMVQNMRFTKETWNDANGKTQALLKDYFDRGGAHAMITVVGKDDLKNAMERPDEYRDLIVRLGGLSLRYVELTKDVQQEIYDRTTY